MRTVEKTYVVEASKYGEFPLDMLRYDSAEAASPEDATLIERLNVFGSDKDDLPKRVRVTLRTASRFAPTVARWESFGCKVVECSDPTVMLSRASPSKANRPRLEFISIQKRHDADFDLTDGLRKVARVWKTPKGDWCISGEGAYAKIGADERFAEPSDAVSHFLTEVIL